jgi:hypothetical protein
MRLMRNQHATHVDFFQFRGLIETNPKATPCNIDMVFERKCKFFVGEWKRESESMSQGQGLLLRNLARQPQFTVVIIQGNTDGETVVEKFEQLCSDGIFRVRGKSFDDLKSFVTRWYNWADAQEFS